MWFLSLSATWNYFSHSTSHNAELHILDTHKSMIIPSMPVHEKQCLLPFVCTHTWREGQKNWLIFDLIDNMS